MTEHEPHGAPFDEQPLTEALETQSATVRDVAYGEGVQYSVGRGDARLEILSRTGVTRLTAQDVRVELFGHAIPEASGSGVEFVRSHPGQEASLTIVPGGGIVFTLIAGGVRTPADASEPDEPLSAPRPPTPAPVRAPELSQEARSDVTDTSAPPPATAAPGAPSTAREPASPAIGERATSEKQTAAETKQEKITLTGRLGQDPSFRTSTKTGTLIGRFPLAVHREDGNTTWHTVLAFGQRAEQLQRRLDAGELTKGREVDVVGYLHVNEWTDKDGKTRKTKQIHAVAVKKR